MKHLFPWIALAWFVIWRRLFDLFFYLFRPFLIANIQPPSNPSSIFILRNNDMGDLLATTPLFEALHRRFPQARITVGIGEWNREILDNNPHITDTLAVNAPWWNRSLPTGNFLRNFFYIFMSKEASFLTAQHYDIGIDVLGSAWGTLLFLKAKIPYRLGVKGYAGGHTASHQWIEHSLQEHVSTASLKFAKLLGAENLPPAKPQIYLSPLEIQEGEALWQNFFPSKTKRIVLAPGGGRPEKCWPLASYRDLILELLEAFPCQVLLLGSEQDDEKTQTLEADPHRVKNLSGSLSLRESFAVIQSADLVICNSSMVMHAAAAFDKKTLVLLSDAYASSSQHAAQWGYPHTLIVGKETNKRAEIYSPLEAIQVLTPWLKN